MFIKQLLIIWQITENRNNGGARAAIVRHRVGGGERVRDAAVPQLLLICSQHHYAVRQLQKSAVTLHTKSSMSDSNTQMSD